MKFVIFGVVTLCAVAFAKLEFLPTELTNGVFRNRQGPYSLKVALSEKENYQLADEQALLEGYLGRSLIADTIMNALEDFRDVVINGNESLPPLDPLVVDEIGPYKYDITGVRATFVVNNLRAEGLRWYVVDHVTFNALRLTFGAQVTLPWLTVTGTYDSEARVALLSHRAGGNFRVFINRFEVGVDMRLGTNLFGGHLLLRELDIRLDIADTNIQIDGMTGSTLLNSLISSYLQNLTQDIIQTHLEDVSRIISEEVFDSINEILKDYTLNDILG